MEEISFSALAPRRGTRPMLASWSDIGTSAMSGGAFNWGSLWSGIKNFGSSVKNYGNKIWNSSTGQALRDKLKETKVQEKLVDGINAGIHGALDIAKQELDKKIAQKLDKPTVIPEVEPPMEPDEVLGPITTKPSKRPIEEEEIITKVEGPPSYDEIFGNKSPPPLVPTTKPRPPPPTHPTTRPHPSMVTPVLPPDPVASQPVTLDLPKPPRPTIFTRPSRNNWQSTLNSIVGLGVRTAKKRRCFY